MSYGNDCASVFYEGDLMEINRGLGIEMGTVEVPVAVQAISVIKAGLPRSFSLHLGYKL